jgi:hypothetical protein
MLKFRGHTQLVTASKLIRGTVLLLAVVNTLYMIVVLIVFLLGRTYYLSTNSVYVRYGKVVLVLNQAHAMKMYWGVEV